MDDFRFNITRKSDGVITHSVTGNGDQPDRIHTAWGDPSSYDIVKVDLRPARQAEQDVIDRLNLAKAKPVLTVAELTEVVKDLITKLNL